jgi:hypothetical protein
MNRPEANQVGLLKYATVTCLFLYRYASLQPHLERWVSLDSYIAVKFVLLLVVIWLPQNWLWVAAIVAAYLLFEMFVYRFKTLLSESIEPRPSYESLEKSLLYFIVNIGEVILAFAIFYRLTPNVCEADAIWVCVADTISWACLVLGTAGFPDKARGVAAFQVVLDFCLLLFSLVRLLRGDTPIQLSDPDCVRPNLIGIF